MIKGIYQKGHIIQSINYIQSCEQISKILFEADKKDPNNPRIKQMMGDLVEIASYVAYLERTLANKEIKQLTNKENKKEIKKALIELAVLFLSIYASFWLGVLLIINL